MLTCSGVNLLRSAIVTGAIGGDSVVETVGFVAGTEFVAGFESHKGAFKSSLIVRVDIAASSISVVLDVVDAAMFDGVSRVPVPVTFALPESAACTTCAVVDAIDPGADVYYSYIRNTMSTHVGTI